MIDAFKTLKKWQKKTIIASLVIVSTAILLFSSLWFFVQSSLFRSMLNDYIVEVSGERIELSEEIRVISLFPNLSIDLPSAKARLQHFSFGYERVRFDGLRATFSPAFILSQGSRGQVVFSMKGLAAIAATESTSSHSDTKATSATAQLSEFLQQLDKVNLLLTIDQLDYISRDSETGNTHIIAKNLTFEARRSSIWLAIEELSDNKQKVSIDTELKNLNWSADNPARLHGTLAFEMAKYQSVNKPITIQSDFTASANSLELNDLKLHNKFLRLDGSLVLSETNNKTRVRGTLDVKQLDLEGIQNEFAVNGTEHTSKRIFTDQPFDFSYIEQNDIKLDLIFSGIHFNGQAMLDGKGTLAAYESEITLVGDELSVMGGTTSFEAKFSELNKTPLLRMKLSVNDMQLQRLHLDKNTESIMDKGLADALVAVRGRGNSSSQLAGSLRGYITIAMADIEIKPQYVSRFDKGVIKWAKENVSKLSKKKDNKVLEQNNIKTSLPIGCASFKSQINNGRMEFSNGAIIEMPENTIFSSGYVDLEKEEIGVLFNTRRTTYFDWSTISLLKYLEIGGTLAKPSYAINTFELAKQGVLSYAGVVYGPLPSLVYSLGEAGQMQFSQAKCIREIN